jgi:hypothetical protein
MNSATLKRTLASVDWQGIETYTTRKGKSRMIRKGIPSRLFWRRWKAHGQELRQAGLSLAISGQSTAYNRKTGKTRTIKQWEVIAWNLSIF